MSSDRAADMRRESAKKKRREMEQASMDAASDLLDTDSNATFAMVNFTIVCQSQRFDLAFKLLLFFQKPLVRHAGDPLSMEKLRQCEVHMAPPKRPNCCRTWLSKFPTR